MLLMTCLFIGIGLVNAQVSKVTGTVTSHEDGLPVVGASVLVKGTQIGTVTDIDGNFTITNVPSSAGTLVVSFIGMKTQEVAVKSVVNVVLHSDTELLDEVVVVGYGSGKKLGSVVGSVATVNSDKIAIRPSSNFTDALQGQVAGLQVISSTGEPSSTSSMNIRGINSINASNSPLFILDGAQISSATFTALNPNDIANITVLKDASSTAIYGSRAANGVIIITTKRAKNGEKARVSLRAQYGVSQITRDNVDMMNTEQYYRFQEILDPTLSSNASYLEKKQYTLDHGIDTNWRDYVYRDNAPTTQLDATISGAGESLNYYASFGHFDQEGIAALGSSLRRESLRTNLDTKINDWIKFGANVNLSYQKAVTLGFTNTDGGLSIFNSTSLARNGLPTQPIYEIIDHEDGTWEYGDELDWFDVMGQYNPNFVLGLQPQSRSTAQVNANTYFQLTPIKGLNIRAAQAMDAFDYTYSYKFYPDPVANGGKGSAMELFQRYYAFTYTNTAEYKFTISEKNYFTALVGQESIIKKNQNFSAESEGQTDKRLMLLSAGTSPKMPGHEIKESVFNSYFGQIDYNYDDKYYLNASLRTDGSSLFGADNRWATFYSVGAMWNISKENFMDDINWINDLRLKVSYGTTGNSGISEYLALGLIGNSDGYSYNNDGVVYTMNASNPELSWETVKNLNLALNTRLFDRLSLDVEFYNKQTENMLLNIPYSYTTGFSSGWGNVGSMRNRGVDVTLGLDIIKNKDFFWSVNANVNYNKNEITELYGNVEQYEGGGNYCLIKKGESYGSFYLVEWAGVDPRDGQNMYYDLNGNITKKYSEANRKISGKSWVAPWSGGLSTQFGWKGLSVAADFSWMADKYVMNIDRYFYENPKFDGNKSVKLLNIWQKPGDVTNVASVNSAMQIDSNLLENASFLRLKNLTISYTLPKMWMVKTGFIENLRVYLVGRNLFTITPFNGYDPEINNSFTLGGYPNTKQYSAGVEITF